MSRERANGEQPFRARSNRKLCGGCSPSLHSPQTMQDVVTTSIGLSCLCALLTIPVHISAAVIHGIWVAPFIERHGRRTAGFFSHWVLGTGMLRDLRLLRELTSTPMISRCWMTWFRLLLILWQVLLIAAILLVLVGSIAYAVG